MASGVVALFFLRFWRETRDRLFVIFAAAFALLGITRLALIFVLCLLLIILAQYLPFLQSNPMQVFHTH